MTKKELRILYKQKRIDLSAREVVKLDDLMLIQFQRLDFGFDLQVLLSYLPMYNNQEIDPRLFSDYLQIMLPQLQVAYPVINTHDCSMQSFLVSTQTNFNTNLYGIEEPADGIPLTNENIDLVFVPLLAFDQAGYRVGYGKGYYDRFLSACRSDVITVGFSYFEAIGKIEDTNQFDIPLNYCITPHQLYEF